MFFIGIDVHKEQSQICILEEQGQVKCKTQVPPTRPELADVPRRHLPGTVAMCFAPGVVSLHNPIW
jgi:hypothetical protein